LREETVGRQYDRLSSAERAVIMVMLREGSSRRAIARRLDRAPSTIGREIRRQPERRRLPYEATRAAAQAFARSRKSRNPRKLKPGEALFETVAGHLRQGWSPLHIAGRLRRMHPDDSSQTVCHETIYVALYALPRGALRRELLACLRQGHQQRRPRSRGADRRKDRIAEELRIASRPESIEERRIPGHWEGDLLKGAYNRSAVSTLVERSTRLVMIAKTDKADALSVQHAIERMFGTLPPGLRKTLTYDRGSEMARHAELTRTTGVKVYFADPYSPWNPGAARQQREHQRPHPPVSPQGHRLERLLTGRSRRHRPSAQHPAAQGARLPDPARGLRRVLRSRDRQDAKWCAWALTPPAAIREPRFLSP
jgi:IS30 family transposase